MAFSDLRGQRFGRLIVRQQPLIRKLSGRQKVTLWLCQCDCGSMVEVRAQNLVRGLTKSCGCHKRDLLIARNIEIGKADGNYAGHIREYGSWQSALARCYNPKNMNFHNYGGRGITMCDEWRSSFSAFLRNMGPRPYGMTLERRDTNGNYCPENCCWATQKQQSANKRNNHLIEYAGETKTLSEWAQYFGVPAATIVSRIKYKWDREYIFLPPDERRTPLVKRPEFHAIARQIQY